MKFTLHVVALAATALVPATTVLAADYEPPIYVDQAPEYTPVEIGSGWYLRGDVAYLPKDTYRDVDFGGPGIDYSEREKPVFASLGFGYHFNDYLRGDFNLGWLPGNKIDIAFDTPPESGSAHVKNSAFTAMVNGYVDLGTYVGITPYVGAGIGVMQARRRMSMDYTDADGTLSAYDRHTQYALAYSLNAGAAYQVSKNVMLDVGYQYLSAPNAKYYSLDGAHESVLRKGIDSHQIKVGLRYDLW